jgi:hypothetical protein
MSEDTDRQHRIVFIKGMEKSGVSFLEMVALYNAKFQTNHFAEVFSKDPLVNQTAKALVGKRSNKEVIKDMHDILLGDNFLGF